MITCWSHRNFKIRKISGLPASPVVSQVLQNHKVVGFWLAITPRGMVALSRLITGTRCQLPSKLLAQGTGKLLPILCCRRTWSSFGVCLKDYAFDLDSFQPAGRGSCGPLGQRYMDTLFQGLKDYRNSL